ncbi:MAG TPA: MlaD family protein [Solirubrobacteraceae bacterium]|nr:MlaD family protein [Solirubrobacteraceae bacterium]
MRRVLLSAAIGLVVVALIVIFAGFTSGPSNPTYKLEFGNAFGLVKGAPFKVAGVPAGSISSINLCYEDKTAHCQNKLDALVTVQVTTKGFGAFRSDASCQSRPQSLIGEYFVDCQPGQNGKALASGATLTSSHTFSTIPADLLADIMRMPQRERFTLIINELGAAVAGRSTDLQTALQRAVPAIDETDNLLNLLGNDSQTLKALTANSNAVVTALANNSTQVQNFIVEADKAATDTATQQANLKTSLQRFPGLLEQLKPTMAKLGTAATANTPVLTNLNAAAGQLHTFFTNLAPCSLPHKGNQCGFANASLPALQSLGQASVTGKTAVQAAAPTVAILNKFAAPTSQGGAGTGELAQNLAIVLGDLDNQDRAVEPDPRSPGGKGFSGLQALLQYVFNQPLAINEFGQYGHMLAVDAFLNPMCSPYASPGTVASNLKQYGAAYRQCYSWLGPNQPGVNETDPSDPSACVPDPGGAPPGHTGPTTSASKCPAAALSTNPPNAKKGNKATTPATTTNSNTPSTGASSGVSPPSPPSVQNALGQVNKAIGAATAPLGGVTPSVPSVPVPSVPVPTTPQPQTSNPNNGAPSAQQAQQLLNYLLSP